MKVHRAGIPLAFLALLCGCHSGPRFTYDPQQDVSMTHYPEIALDPRTDLIFGMEGMRPLNDTPFKAMVMHELQRKGYRIVAAAEAKLWVDVFALGKAQEHGMGTHGDGPSHGGMRGGGMRGGMPSPGPGGGMPGGEPSRGGRPGGESMGGHPGDSPMGGPLMLVVALLEPTEAAPVRWRGILEWTPDRKNEPLGGPSFEDEIKRLLAPLDHPASR